MSSIYNSTMSYSSRSHMDTLGSISLLKSFNPPAPVPTSTSDELSVSTILNVLDSFNVNQLNSYDVATLLAPIITNPSITTSNGGLSAIYTVINSIPLSLSDVAILSGALVAADLLKLFVVPSITIPPGFQNIVLFSTPLSQSAQIRYHISTSGMSLSDDSVQRISTLVSEVYSMKPDFPSNLPIFTFTEIMKDKDGNSHMCSMRAIFYNTTFYPSSDSPNALYFVMSHMNVNNFVKFNSFNTIMAQISSTKRLLNFSYIVLKKDILTLQSTNTKTFKDYINSRFNERFGGKGIYIFCYRLSNDAYSSILKPYDDTLHYDTILLHEQNPQWAGAESQTLFASNTDLLVSQVTYNIYKSLLNHFEFRKDVQFGVNYKWNYGQKHSSCILLDINSTTYMIGCGVNLETFIPNAIKTTGDTLLSGDLNIKDISGNSIFQVSNSEKKITSAYKVGVGKDQPQTTMDIEDTSMASILNVVDKISATAQLINANIEKLSSRSSLPFSSIVSAFTDPITPLIQTPFHYVSIYELNPDYVTADQIVHYNWLFGTNPATKIWDLTTPVLVSSLPVSNQQQFLTTYITTLFQKTFVGSPVMSGVTVDWLYGKKHALNKFFTNNDKIYWIGSGVDLQQYNLRYNTNDNIERLFNCINTYQLLLQVIVQPHAPIPVDTNGIPTSNYIQPLETLKNSMTTYGNPSAIRRYDVILGTVANANPFDYTIETNTLKDMVNLFNTRLTYKPAVNTDSNSSIMYKSFFAQIRKNYPSLSDGQNGIIWFEDSKEYYVSIFYRDAAAITSIEFRLDTFIIPTLKVSGDTRVNGELTTRVLNQSVNFTTIDPDRNFIGFGTDERQLYYDSTVQNPFFYVSNASNYPTAVFNRTDLTSPVSTIVNVKRSLTTAPVGVGLDIGFEITNNASHTHRLGSIGMRTEDLNLNSGFFVKAKDNDILSVSNSGKMKVESILLTGTPLVSYSGGNLTINLGSSSFGSQTVNLTSDSSMVYTGGVDSGTYTIKINLNGHAISFSSSNTFNFATNTNNSATILLVKVNVFTPQYFTNMTYY